MQVRNDLYRLMGLPDFAPVEDIKKAYKSLALKWHPDRVPEAEKEKATEVMKNVNSIYEFLIKNKAAYDTALQQARQPRVVVQYVVHGWHSWTNGTGSGSSTSTTNFY